MGNDKMRFNPLNIVTASILLLDKLITDNAIIGEIILTNKLAINTCENPIMTMSENRNMIIEKNRLKT